LALPHARDTIIAGPLVSIVHVPILECKIVTSILPAFDILNVRLRSGLNSQSGSI
jgi:molybdopterin-binding protein